MRRFNTKRFYTHNASIVFNSHKLKKLIMFDITNREIREQKLKFIEILLVVGGIIGGLRLQNENDPMNITFGLFLMGSLVYYFMLSNTKINSRAVSRSVLIGFIMAISFTSFGFSAIAILPFIIKGIISLIGGLIMIIWLLLSVLIFISLYR